MILRASIEADGSCEYFIGDNKVFKKTYDEATEFVIKFEKLRYTLEEIKDAEWVSWRRDKKGYMDIPTIRQLASDILMATS